MTAFIFALLLAGIAVLTMVVRKTYALVPLHELRRQSQAGDELARKLYSVAAYGPASQMLLWIILLLSVAGSIVLMAQVVPDFLIFGYSLLLIGYVLVWLPFSDVTSYGLKSVVWATPVILWLVSHLFVVLEKPAVAVHGRQTAPLHTGLYEKQDLVALLERQKEQEDSRFTEHEINQLLGTLNFAHKKVADIMVPRKKVKSLSADDSIGPIIMDELHASGQKIFAVHKSGDRETIIGTLQLSDIAGSPKSGHIRDIMNAKVCYVNEDFTLEQLLHAFLETQQHVLVVVNNFGEFVGLVGIAATLREALGRDVYSEFSQYADLQAIANYRPVEETRNTAKKKTPSNQ